MDFVWHSFELRPVGAPPISEAYRQRVLAARPVFAAAMKEELGVEIKSGPFGIDSRPSLIGAKFAEEQGVGEAYHWAVLRAYWEEEKDISDLGVLQEIAAEIGLDPDRYLASLSSADFAAEVDADVEQASLYGLSGVPSMIFAEKYLIVGAQPLPVLEEAVVEIRQREGLTDTGDGRTQSS
jgi:predicted DsbA family dithiol-disulfide isomerase